MFVPCLTMALQVKIAPSRFLGTDIRPNTRGSSNTERGELIIEYFKYSKSRTHRGIVSNRSGSAASGIYVLLGSSFFGLSLAALVGKFLDVANDKTNVERARAAECEDAGCRQPRVSS